MGGWANPQNNIEQAHPPGKKNLARRRIFGKKIEHMKLSRRSIFFLNGFSNYSQLQIVVKHMFRVFLLSLMTKKSDKAGKNSSGYESRNTLILQKRSFLAKN